MTRRLAAVLTACASLAVACGSAPSPQDGGYPFTASPGTGSVRLDSAALRSAKAEAQIADCPRLTSAKPVKGGLPEITLPCLGGGRPVNLADLRGKPTVLNFWAQTCGPCRTESPLFQRLHEAAGGRLAVIGVDWYDPQPARALAFADELGLRYPQLADPDGVTRAPLRISGLPVTLFVDADGTVVHAEYGAVESAGQLQSLVEKYLDVPVAMR